jgi:hypothetical protein
MSSSGIKFKKSCVSTICEYAETILSEEVEEYKTFHNFTKTDMKIPKTPTELFNWCKYFYTFDPLITGSINSLAAFPVTEVFLEDRNGRERRSQIKLGYIEKCFSITLKYIKCLLK